MKLVKTVGISLFVFVSSSSAQINHYFKKSFGQNAPIVEIPLSITVLPDGYLFTADRFNALNQHDAPAIFKINLDGDSIWEYTFVDSSKIYYWNNLQRKNDKVYSSGIHWIPSTDKWSAYFAKLDTSGNLISEHVLSDSIFDSFSYQMSKTFDGNFLLIGDKENVTTFTDGYIVKVDTAGNKILEKTFPGGNYYDTFNWIEQLSDSSFIACGVYDWASAGKGWILKLDTSCNVQWQRLKSFWPNGRTVYSCIKPAIDGGYIVVGHSNLMNGTGIVTKTDDLGFEQWTKFFSPDVNYPLDGFVQEIIPLQDSTYVICGQMPDSVSGYLYYQGFISKLDINGNELWRRKYFVYPFNDTQFFDMDTTADGGFILIGRGESVNDVNAFVVKTNCLGFADPPFSDFTYTHNGNTTTFYNLSQYADTCIYNFGDGTYQIVLLTDTNPIIHTYATASTYPVTLTVHACGDSASYTFNVITAIDDAQLIQKTLLVYPNPAATSLTIKCRLNANAHLVITDVAGRQLSKQYINENTPATVIDLKTFAAGTYFASIVQYGNTVAVRRFMKD